MSLLVSVGTYFQERLILFLDKRAFFGGWYRRVHYLFIAFSSSLLKIKYWRYVDHCDYHLNNNIGPWQSLIVVVRKFVEGKSTAWNNLMTIF